MGRCDFMPLTAELASLPFCCGETEGEFSEIVAFFMVSNDRVKTLNYKYEKS